MYTIVVYDISDVKKQTKIRNFLRKYLYKVQLSVFHGDLNPSKLKEIELFFDKISYRDNESIIIFYIPIQSRVNYKIYGKKNVQKDNII